MKIIHKPRIMSGLSCKIKMQHKTIGLVPTMGALHEGHLSLIRRARKDNDYVVVSIFVNPTQFSPKEDLKKYPRPLKQDMRLCKKEGVDIIFYPSVEMMYPKDYKTYIKVSKLDEVLCGKFRPGHFQGVTTVVAKLFNIVSADNAYFGQKDAQQAIIIQKMVIDLNIPVRIKITPTVREKDGLAMSSRNAYLNQKERKEAVVLYQALKLAGRLIKQGNKNSADIIKRMQYLILTKKSAKIQYLAIVDTQDLRLVSRIKEKILIALAVSIGKTRLIDNITVVP
ncbi:MAG: pantoate--beta-alanine ligase [Omnitrophica WOR_2 bacterium RBG_13_41_10]|nr:MAG: pantoate--beta-alanine ligase [Omnitrophica WOR_2 bacterium RBG_13_41_10]